MSLTRPHVSSATARSACGVERFHFVGCAIAPQLDLGPSLSISTTWRLASYKVHVPCSYPTKILYHKIPTTDKIHLYTTPADASPFGISVYLKYGFTSLKLGNTSFASSFLTLGWMITSSPGFQSTGVVMRYLSDACRESMTRSSSAVFRPVEAG